MTICLATLAFPPPFKIPNYFLMSPISPQLSTTVQRPQQQSILNYGRLLGGGGGDCCWLSPQHNTPMMPNYLNGKYGKGTHSHTLRSI